MKNRGKHITTTKESNKKENSKKHGGKPKVAKIVKRQDETIIKHDKIVEKQASEKKKLQEVISIVD